MDVISIRSTRGIQFPQQPTNVLHRLRQIASSGSTCSCEQTCGDTTMYSEYPRVLSYSSAGRPQRECSDLWDGIAAGRQWKVSRCHCLRWQTLIPVQPDQVHRQGITGYLRLSLQRADRSRMRMFSPHIAWSGRGERLEKV